MKSKQTAEDYMYHLNYCKDRIAQLLIAQDSMEKEIIVLEAEIKDAKLALKTLDK